MKSSPDSKLKKVKMSKKEIKVKKVPKIESLKKSSPIRKKKSKSLSDSSLKAAVPQLKVLKNQEDSKESLVKVSKKLQLGLQKKKKVRTLEKSGKKSANKNISKDVKTKGLSSSTDNKQNADKPKETKKLKRVRAQRISESNSIVEQLSQPTSDKKNNKESTRSSDAPKIGTKRKRVSKIEKESTVSVNDESENTALTKTQRRRHRRKQGAKSQEKEEVSPDIYLKDLSRKHVLQCISAIFHLTQEQIKDKQDLFAGESKPIFLQVTCIRVPRVPKRYIRTLLPHSIVSPEDEVALIVCDLERGRRKSYEPTVEHYQELLEKSGCKRIKDVIPLNQIKTEYDQFDLRRKLVGSYDHFLVDGKIAGHVTHYLGKIFTKKRKMPISIHADSKDLNHEIEYALKKTSMLIHSFGDMHIMQIGTTTMGKKQICENIFKACEFLAKNYPGGWENIRALQIKSTHTSSLPIYSSLKDKNAVKVPVVKTKRPKAYRNVEGELTTLPGDTKVIVTPEGEVTLEQNLEGESEESVSEESDDEQKA